MNLIDALKTGRRIKRSCNVTWVSPNSGGIHLAKFSSDDVTATDWEVEPERYEFECKFKMSANLGNVFIDPTTNESCYVLKEIPFNKKCKVTVEVLDA